MLNILLFLPVWSLDCTRFQICNKTTLNQGCHFVRTGIGVSGVNERQRAIWRRFAQAEAPPENGAVDGVTTEDSHRYEVGVIEAAEVKRPFRVVTVKPRQSDICGEPEEKSFLSRIFG